MKEVNIDRVREIVAEELNALQERLDHEGIRGVVDSAARMLAAMDDFEEKASGPMMNSVSLNLKKFRSSLEHIINNPQSYLDHSKKIVVKKKNPSHKLTVKDPSTGSSKKPL